MRLPVFAVFLTLLGSCQDTGRSDGRPADLRFASLEPARFEEQTLVEDLDHPVCLLAVDDDTLILLRDGRIANSKLNWPKLPGTPLAAVKENAHSGLCLCQLADDSLQLLRLEDGHVQVLGPLPGNAPAALAFDSKNLLAASANPGGGSDLIAIKLESTSLSTEKISSSTLPIRSLLALPDHRLAWIEAAEDRPDIPIGPDAPSQRLMLKKSGTEAQPLMAYNHTPVPALKDFGQGRSEARIFRPEGIERLHPALGGSLLIAERARSWIRCGNIAAVNFDHQVFLPFLKFTRPRDIQVDRLGRLLVLEDDSQLGHLGGRLRAWTYRNGNRDPVIQLSLSSESGPAPLMLTADATGSTDKDGDPLTFAWKLDGHVLPGEGRLPLLLADKGAHELELRVEDSHGGSAMAKRHILVGIDPLSIFLVPDSSLRPEAYDRIELISRGKIGEVAPGKAVAEMKFSGLDRPPPPRIVSFELGRTFETALDSAEKARSAQIQIRSFENLKTPQLYCSAFSHPSRIEAEFAGAGDGIKLVDYNGARCVQRATGGTGWLVVDGVDLGGITKLKARIATQGAGGAVSLRLGNPSGPGLGAFIVPAGKDEWKEIDFELHNNPSGRSQIWILITPDRNRSSILWLDWISFLTETKDKDGKDPRHP